MLVNLTPHELNIHVTEKIDLETNRMIENIINVPPSGDIARVSMTSVHDGFIHVPDSSPIPIFKASYGEVVGLPQPDGESVFIVSGIVAARVARDDVFSPGDLVRDAAGKPIGCKGLKK